MNKFIQHIPAFVDTDSPPDSFEFETTEQLLENRGINRWAQDETFSHYAMSGNFLMAISDGGRHWWVLGYIRDPQAVHLPQWDHGIYTLEDEHRKKIEVRGTLVEWSRGDQVKLADGRVLKNLKYGSRP